MPIDIPGNGYIIQISDDHRSVELWSSERLPFEPKGRLYQMRNHLRTAIAGLREDHSSLLLAEYRSDRASDSFDLENVLFYNIGSSYFRKLDERRLRIERVHGAIPPTPDGKQYEHYHRYSVEREDEGAPEPDRTSILMRWQGVVIPRPSEGVKPAVYWAALQSAEALRIARGTNRTYPSYGLILLVQAPESVHLAGAMKPLIDGMVSAMHGHDGFNVDKVARRLSAQLNVNAEKVKTMLLDESKSVLGKKKLLVARANGVQWQPDDHLISLIDIGVERVAISQWMMSGSFFAIGDPI